MFIDITTIVLIIFQKLFIQKICFIYYIVCGYGHCLFLIIRALLLFLQKGFQREDGYYKNNIDTIMIIFTVILALYRGSVVFVLKKEMSSVKKLDIYNRNEKQEKFIASIERKIENIDASFNQLTDTGID